jgi:hypothetical protein
MANSKLQGQKTFIPQKVQTHLSRIFTAYNGDETVEGYARLKKLVDKDQITYEQMKRMKNFFDGYDGKRNSTPYLLNGGTMMKEWINKTLKDARKNIEGKKKAMKDTGMSNQYQKSHSKDGVKLDTHDSDTNKILRQEGIYSIGIMENLIKTIDKNKQLWHTTEHQSHQS